MTSSPEADSSRKQQVPTAENSTTRVTAEIRAAIVSGELSPSSWLRAEPLAERFGTSRSPVREALLSLQREGLVDVLPNRGAIVRAFDSDDLVDLYELRCVLEPYAASRAAGRIDGPGLVRMEELCDRAERETGESSAVVESLLGFNLQFHRLILEAADSPRLAEAMEGAGGIPRQFRSVFWAAPAQRDRALHQHREIFAALKTGNSELAGSAMRVHLLQALEFLWSLIVKDDTRSQD